jgi:hypothetical protein
MMMDTDRNVRELHQPAKALYGIDFRSQDSELATHLTLYRTVKNRWETLS